jgi:hypothetical protein
MLLLISSCATNNMSYKSKAMAYKNIVTKERKVIYNARLTLTVKNIDSANAFITSLVNNYEGYLVTVGNSKTEIRVKSIFLNNTLSDLNKIGTVTNKNVFGQDVTEEYFDNEIRLENAKKARQRYLELLQKAENVATTLLVEKELERLNGEIDIIEGKLKRMNHLTEFSTIDIYLEQKEKLGILGYIFVGLFKGIGWLFVR